jgi:ribosomal protein L35
MTKTTKAIAKRFGVAKKTGKVTKRTAGQAHLNGKQTSKKRRNKLSDINYDHTYPFNKVVRQNV